MGRDEHIVEHHRGKGVERVDEAYAIRRYQQAAALLPLRWQRLCRQVPEEQQAEAEELAAIGADTFIRVGTAGRVCDAAFDETLDGVINTAAVRDEGTTIHYIPIEYPAVADRHVVDALAVAAKNLGYHYAEGITQSKDSFYGQHEPENMPAESRLKERWEAWRRGNVMTSEMEAAALFVISSIRGCRAASIMSFVDMKKTIEVARDALKILIKQDAAK